MSTPVTLVLAPEHLFLLNPDERKNLLQQRDEALSLVRATVGPQVVIRSAEEKLAIAVLLSRGAAARSKLEGMRKAAVNPLNDQVRRINALFAQITDVLLMLDREGKAKVGEWDKQEAARVERERLASLQRQEEEARREMEAMERAAQAKTEPERIEALQEAQAASVAQSEAALAAPHDPPKHVKTMDGSLIQRKRWTHELVDKTLVPREYLEVNSKAITAAIRAGVRQIPGVNIFEEPDYAVRPGV